jgi:hypothetical protein
MRNMCVICGITTKNKKYCSEKCQYEGYRRKAKKITLICEFCKNPFLVRKQYYKIHSNKKYCSRQCKDIHQKEVYTGSGNPCYGKGLTDEAQYQKKITKMFNSAKRRAKEHGMEFNITKEDIIIPEKCPLLDIPLFSSIKKCSNNSPSLDRIDSSKGYLKENIHVISFKANTIKSNASIEEIELLLNRLKNIWQK